MANPRGWNGTGARPPRVAAAVERWKASWAKPPPLKYVDAEAYDVLKHRNTLIRNPHREYDFIHNFNVRVEHEHKAKDEPSLVLPECYVVIERPWMARCIRYKLKGHTFNEVTPECMTMALRFAEVKPPDLKCAALPMFDVVSDELTFELVKHDGAVEPINLVWFRYLEVS